MRQVIDYKLFDRDEYFFAPNFCENSFLKDLLIKKYSTGIDMWKKKHNSGNIKNDSETKKKYPHLCEYPLNIASAYLLCVLITECLVHRSVFSHLLSAAFLRHDDETARFLQHPH